MSACLDSVPPQGIELGEPDLATTSSIARSRESRYAAWVFSVIDVAEGKTWINSKER